MKKILGILTCVDAIVIYLIIFFMIYKMELDMIVVRYVYTNFGLRIDWYFLFIGSILLAMLVYALHRLYYNAVYKLHPLFSRSLFFLGMMLLKYALPTYLLWTLNFDNAPILLKIPNEYLVFKSVMVVSLLADMMVFNFTFTEKSIISIRFGERTYSFRCMIIYKIITIATWATLSITLLKFIEKKMDEKTEQKISR